MPKEGDKFNIEKQEAGRDIINVAGDYIIHAPKTQEPISIPTTQEQNMSLGSLKIFLCHSSGDKAAVRDLYQRLRAEGFKPWLDEEDLLPGQEWQMEIPKAVKKSDIVIVCLSRSSINKEGYVQKEIKDALDAADEKPEGIIFIIPLKLEECNVPERLSSKHWVNLYEDKGFEKLVRSLQQRNSQLKETHPLQQRNSQLKETHPLQKRNSQLKEKEKATKQEDELKQIISLSRAIRDTQLSNNNPVLEPLPVQDVKPNDRKIDWELIISIISIIGIIILVLYTYNDVFPEDFSISVSPMAGQVQQQGVILTNITVSGENGYRNAVSLSATTQIPGINVTITPSIGNALPQYFSKVMISVDSDVPIGIYGIIIRGQGEDGKFHSTNYNLNVISGSTLIMPTRITTSSIPK